MNSEKNDRAEFFRQLRWADLHAWAGDTICERGRAYQREHRVQELAHTPDGGLVASVIGTETYVTHVDVQDEQLTSSCTCPYDGTCKHAVAVVLEYLETLKLGTEVPAATDSRGKSAPIAVRRRDQPVEDNSDNTDNDESFLNAYLNKQNKQQLVSLIESMAGRYPAVGEFLDDQMRLSVGEASGLVESIRKQIASLASRPGWTHHWDGEGYVPDYSEVRHRLQMLLSNGHADEVVELGRELFEAGTNQVEMSDDEGETAQQIASCMGVVFQALPRSSLSPYRQMLWAVNCELSDEYELCSGSDVFWDKKHKAADWSALADELRRRLSRFKPPKGDDEIRSYHRDALTDWIIVALDEAGRAEEMITLCQQEAPLTGSYVRLVRRLLQAGREEEAEEWIRRGIGSLRGRLPGIGAQLRDILYEMRRKAKDWPAVAALDADAFFARPELKSYERLRQSSEQAKIWPEVRKAVLRYLETGDFPEMGERRGQAKTAALWPLPDTGLRQETATGLKQFPFLETLIDIAIAEKRTDDVLRWYDQSLGGRGRAWWGAREDKVAQAISIGHPDRAIAIWKALSEDLIGQTQPHAYEQAAIYLAKVRRTLDRTGRSSDWKSYVAILRAANVRKKRLMDVLARLDDRPIIETGTRASRMWPARETRSPNLNHS